MRYGFLVLFFSALSLVAFSQSADYHFNRGNFLANNGDLKEAITHYSKALEFDPKLVEAYLSRGIAHYKLQQFVAAIQDYTKAIQLKPDDAEAHFNRGVCKTKSNDLAGALQDYNRAILLNPQYAQAYMNRGNCRYKLNDKEGACKDWHRASEFGLHDANNENYCNDLKANQN